MTLVITTISPKRRKRRTKTIHVDLPEDVGRNYFTIRLNGPVPRNRPHNVDSVTWTTMRKVYRMLNVRQGHVIQVDFIR